MNLFQPAGVVDEPITLLTHWSIMQTETGERHFVGISQDGYGRVSSAIQQFNSTILTGTTRSGRIYVLKGPPGTHPDAAHVWNNWAAINHVKTEIEVTHLVHDQKHWDNPRGEASGDHLPSSPPQAMPPAPVPAPSPAETPTPEPQGQATP